MIQIFDKAAHSLTLITKHDNVSKQHEVIWILLLGYMINLKVYLRSENNDFLHL